MTVLQSRGYRLIDLVCQWAAWDVFGQSAGLPEEILGNARVWLAETNVRGPMAYKFHSIFDIRGIKKVFFEKSSIFMYCIIIEIRW